tara:strand:+ start:1724 stop:3502 length:1779 start_codon:yes stop_codon:yes gene_type:complete
MKDTENIKTLKYLYKLWLNINKKRRNKITLVFLIMLLSGFAEMLTIASVIPFLLIVTDPLKITSNKFGNIIVDFLGISKTDQLSLLFSMIFCIAILISVSLRLLNLWLNARISAQIGNDFSYKLFKRILNRDYEKIISDNSSNSINTLTLHLNNCVGAINNTLTVISASIVCLCISITVMILNSKIFLFSSVLIISTYLIISYIVKNRLIKNSYLISKNTKKQIQIVQESISSIRDIIINNNQKKFLNLYYKSDQKTRIKTAQNLFLSTFPKFTIEAAAILMAVIFSMKLNNPSNGSNQFITSVGALLLSAQRILPLIQQIYSGWATLNNNISSIQIVTDSLEAKTRENTFIEIKNNLPFKKSISFVDVSFKYLNKKKFAIKNLNLQIFKGQKIGVIGETGCGKSTFIDLLMGLLSPTSGKILVDNLSIDKNNPSIIKNYQKLISHVPQKIYLSDCNFAENIAFDEKEFKINFKKVLRASIESESDNFIRETEKGYSTVVGEGGIKLSGGQLQRIAIARALYKNHQILILDEATSALDESTENSVMKNITNTRNNVTLIIVAHRLSTLRNCDQIFEFENGNLKSSGIPSDYL